ncbi:hypothetical protein ISCGN_009334 [Ixodes scapularis]
MIATPSQATILWKTACIFAKKLSLERRDITSEFTRIVIHAKLASIRVMIRDVIRPRKRWTSHCRLPNVPLRSRSPKQSVRRFNGRSNPRLPVSIAAPEEPTLSYAAITLRAPASNTPLPAPGAPSAGSPYAALGSAHQGTSSVRPGRSPGAKEDGRVAYCGERHFRPRSHPPKQVPGEARADIPSSPSTTMGTGERARGEEESGGQARSRDWRTSVKNSENREKKRQGKKRGERDRDRRRQNC